MTKAAESLTTQLRDVARAFCLEVWGQALSAVGIGTESELTIPDMVYNPLALRLAVTPPQPLADTNYASPSSLDQPVSTPSTAPTKNQNQEQEQTHQAKLVDVEKEETTKLAQLKKKKKEKEQEKKREKRKKLQHNSTLDQERLALQINN